jgi:hypothetical protein
MDGKGRTHGDHRSGQKVVVEYHKEKRPLGRPGHRREDNIKMDLKEISCYRLHMILALDRVQ